MVEYFYQLEILVDGHWVLIHQGEDARAVLAAKRTGDRWRLNHVRKEVLQSGYEEHPHGH